MPLGPSESEPADSLETEELVRDEAARPRQRAYSVMLVDDTPVILALARHVLEEAGYETHSSECGAEALATICERDPPFDVVVTDLTMPAMDGFTLIRELRKRSPSTRVILMTGYGNASERVERSHERPDGVLPKPFRPPELLAAIRAVLEGR